MEEVDPSIVDEILNWRLTFENFLRIGGNGVQHIIEGLQNEDLLVSLKTATDELKETLLFNILERPAVMLKENLESLGSMKTSKVEKAQ